MSALRRKLAEMMINPGKSKPYYCEVEYLESTGTQYIDTGIYLTDNHSVEIHYQLTVASQSRKGIYGGLMSNGARHGALLSPSNSYLEAGYGSTNVYYQLGFPDTNRHILYQKKNEIYFDNVLTYTFGTATFTQSSTAPLGNFTYTNYNPASAKYYYSKWWDGDKLVRDYIPVLGWDGKGYMYDKVSGELFGNAGSGDFICGREIHRVDYISSPNKNVCFNTGIFPQFDNFKIEVRAIKEAGTSLFGITGTGNFYDLTGSGSNNYGHYGTSASSFATFALSDQNMPHTFIMENGNIYCDGVLKGSKENETITSAFPMGLFARITNASGAFNDSGNHTIYYTKIWNNGSLVRDYYPAIDETGKAFLFDKVSHQIFDNTGTGDLSYPARKLNYLESSGTQYIDTNYAFTDDFSWEIDFEGISDGCTLFGGRTSSTRTALLYQRIETVNTTTCPIAGLNGTATPFQLDDLRVGRHVVKMSVNSNKGSVWVDDVQVYNNQSFTGTYITGTTQALFADNFGTSVSEHTSSKVYGLKMWQGTTLVRDLIPAYKDGSLGMYDKVNNVFYTNVGTGTFVLSKVYESRYFN